MRLAHSSVAGKVPDVRFHKTKTVFLVLMSVSVNNCFFSSDVRFRERTAYSTCVLPFRNNKIVFSVLMRYGTIVNRGAAAGGELALRRPPPPTPEGS